MKRGTKAQRGLQGLQRRMAGEGAISCKRFGATQYQTCPTLAQGESA
jgi:hypothetical protein